MLFAAGEEAHARGEPVLRRGAREVLERRLEHR